MPVMSDDIVVRIGSGGDRLRDGWLDASGRSLLKRRERSNTMINVQGDDGRM